jgi:hypothetical protein
MEARKTCVLYVLKDYGVACGDCCCCCCCCASRSCNTYKYWCCCSAKLQNGQRPPHRKACRHCELSSPGLYAAVTLPDATVASQ